MLQISPKIAIDASRCTTPFDCKRCLRICPQAVFCVFPRKQVRGQETNKQEAGSYELQAFYRDKCTACMKCVEVCPVQALAVTAP
ncbi:MAG: 4Fe-4S binding protein [Chloroflexi bacterium]|nr:4Fe-4S binding protein [Chloroflexota bacterium]